MADVVPLRQPRRALFSDARGGGLRVTWHDEVDLVVISLWHGQTCVGTVRLPPADAARLAAFLSGHVADWATHHEVTPGEHDNGA